MYLLGSPYLVNGFVISCLQSMIDAPRHSICDSFLTGNFYTARKLACGEHLCSIARTHRPAFETLLRYTYEA